MNCSCSGYMVAKGLTGPNVIHEFGVQPCGYAQPEALVIGSRYALGRPVCTPRFGVLPAGQVGTYVGSDVRGLADFLTVVDGQQAAVKVTGRLIPVRS